MDLRGRAPRGLICPCGMIDGSKRRSMWSVDYRCGEEAARSLVLVWESGFLSF